MTEHAAKANLPLVRMTGVGKTFDGVSVLRNIDLDLVGGEVLALVGENGAGKSTLMKILGGAYDEYEGEVRIGGRAARLHSPAAAQALGIRLIHQELSLIPAMSVAENIFLGSEIRRRLGLVNRGEMNVRARELLMKLGVEIDVSRPVEEFGMAVQQAVEIAKALSSDARVFVMDEPTSALNDDETGRLFELVARLKEHRVAIVFITHRMEEIYRIADRIAVLRDGDLIGTATPDELPPDELVRWMVGREVSQTFPERGAVRVAVVLTVRDLSLTWSEHDRSRVLSDITFELRAGEILGLAGLRGAGNSELLWALFGALGPPDSGRITINGKPYRPASVTAAMNAGLALVTNNRKATGLVLGMDVTDNVTLPTLSDLAILGILLTKRSQRRSAAPVLRELNTRARPGQEAGTLSGGNQQKIMLAKWLLRRPKVFLMDEPTRGIDVGAKHDVYELLARLAAEGMSFIVTMSELPELLAMCHRVLVMRRGQITAELAGEQATPETVTRAAM